MNEIQRPAHRLPVRCNHVEAVQRCSEILAPYRERDAMYRSRRCHEWTAVARRVNDRPVASV